MLRLIPMPASNLHDERTSLLASRPPSYHAANTDADADSDDSSSEQEQASQPLNEVTRADLIWVLAGLWSAVFLGALDGASHCQNLNPPTLKPLRFVTGTIVATLLTPIGSYFEKSNQASYIGTAYLLSVCCFTPLYGQLRCFLVMTRRSWDFFSFSKGRLSDILGRKGAMLLALSLFGMCFFLRSFLYSTILIRAS